MEYLYEGNSLKAGIYKLTNTINGRAYIGSTVGFKRRWKQHTNSLKGNQHQNKFLQADFNKCGELAFAFEILEITNGTKAERLGREEFYITQLFGDVTKCYNLTKRAISPAGPSHNPEVTRKLKSEKAKLAWATHRNREKHAEAIKTGKAESRRKYVFLSPAGETVEVNHIMVFATENSLDYRALYEVASGKAESHRGWRSATKYFGAYDRSYHQAMLTSTYQNISIISTENQILTGALPEVARTAGLNKKSLSQIVSGHKKTLFGWTLYDSNDKEPKGAVGPKRREYRFLSPEGKEFIGRNLNKFCRKQGLEYTQTAQVNDGKRAEYKGWKRLAI